MKRFAWMLLGGLLLSLLPAGHAAAGSSCNRCRDLPALERELFEQEWLQHEFHEYALGNKRPPPPAPDKSWSDSLAAQVLADFQSWLRSPAGAGGSKSAAPELGTNWKDCSLAGYRAVRKGKKVEYEEIPFEEKKYRKKHCPALADYLIAHEQKHVDQCKKYRDSTRVDLGNFMDYAAFDTEAYGAGIRNLRSSIAKLAKECGWQGSTQETKQNPEDREQEDVVPTLKEARELAKSLRKAGGR